MLAGHASRSPVKWVVEEPADNLAGVRGVGEGGTFGPAAVLANAVADALAPLGIEPNDLPMTPAARVGFVSLETTRLIAVAD